MNIFEKQALMEQLRSTVSVNQAKPKEIKAEAKEEAKEAVKTADQIAEEEKRANRQAHVAKIGTKKANREEMDAFYLLCGTLNGLIEAVGSKGCGVDTGALVKRSKLIPNGYRRLRAAESLVAGVIRDMVYTFEPNKRKSIKAHIGNIRIDTQFGKHATKNSENTIISVHDLALLVHAATEACGVRMCPAGHCSQCVLGKCIDRVSFVSRGDRAWWEVFEQASRRDVGMEEE